MNARMTRKTKTPAARRYCLLRGSGVPLLVLFSAALISCPTGFESSLLKQIRESADAAPLFVMKQDTSVVTAGGVFDFGVVATNGPRPVEFVLHNEGTSDLRLTGTPPIQVEPAGFFAVENPQSVIPPGGYGVLRITFSPAEDRIYEANITIFTNDPNTTAFSFTLSGRGTVPDLTPPSVTDRSPSINATNVSVGTSVQITFSEPILEGSVTADNVRVLATGESNPISGQLVLTDAAQKIVFAPTTALEGGVQYEVTLTSGGIKDLAGNGIAATSWAFTTLDVPGKVTNTLRSPANGFQQTPQNVTLQWNAVPGATEYTVYRSASASLNNPVTTVITGTSLPVSNLSLNTTLYWAVEATNETGAGPRSDTWSFFVPPAPAAPTVSSPSNAHQNTYKDVTLDWNATEYAGSYSLYFGKTSPPPLLQNELTGTTFNRSNLDLGSTYYWKVVAVSANGSSEDASPVWSFHVPSVPGAFGNPSPVHLTFGNPFSLSWDQSENAAHYDVYFGTVSDPTTIVATDRTAPNWSLTGEYQYLYLNTRYYWRVEAKNANGRRESATWRFTTESFAPDGLYPNFMATNVERNPIFDGPSITSWSFDPNTEHRTLFYLSTNQKPWTDPDAIRTRTPSGLSANTRYYWCYTRQVRYRIGHRWGFWQTDYRSYVYRFDTGTTTIIDW